MWIVMFIGREQELANLNEMYRNEHFQLFVLYGRRRVGKTTLLKEFCKDKPVIFFSAEQSTRKRNLEKFSTLVFQYYKETTLEAFSSWEKALSFIDNRQSNERLVLVIDEFPYLARKNFELLSEFQHLIDHRLKDGNIFMILCGSYMGFMEKEVLGSKSPLFGRRTGQLHMKPFNYYTALKFFDGFSVEDKLKLYGAYGGTALYLQQVNNQFDFETNIRNTFLQQTAYLYEEPLLLLRQEVQEPGVYNAIIEAIACGASKSNEIATRIGEEPAKCLKYITIMCELGILYKETPFGEKEASRKTLYGISDLMFRFWYRYVYANRSLIEMGVIDAVMKKRIIPNYSEYMGMVFEQICKDYLCRKNAAMELPILFTSIGRWWGTNPKNHAQVEIDLIARDKKDYLFCECKWRNEKIDIGVVNVLREKADVFSKERNMTWFALFSKGGFTDKVKKLAENDDKIILVELADIVK